MFNNLLDLLPLDELKAVLLTVLARLAWHGLLGAADLRVVRPLLKDVDKPVDRAA
jgi:hypothetical protein